LQGGTFTGGIASLTTPAKTKDVFFAESFIAPAVRPIEEAKTRSGGRAEWVIVAPRSMRSAAETLASFHAREGLSTLVVDLEEIYDLYGGSETTPLAIRDFFQTTRNWNKPPRYYVLAGTGSVDYRGIHSDPGPVPPLMTATADGLFASDSLFVDFNNDRLPDASIGRIPVSSASELAAYAAKLDASSRIDTANAPIVFSADALDQGADFRRDSKRAEAALSSRPSKQVYVDELGGTGARAALLAAWQTGTPLVSWIGHGGLDVLSSAEILSSYDAPSLHSNGRLPLLVAMTCTINRFENGFVDPLGTALTRENGAGALAVWSASGLSVHSQADAIQQKFMALASRTPDARVGDIIVPALSAFPSDTSSVYLLLGDPAVKLGLPAETSNVGTPSPNE
jgi:hypothetical protein